MRIERIAEAGKHAGTREGLYYLYYLWYAPELARADLDLYLCELYRDQSDPLVFFSVQ